MKIGFIGTGNMGGALAKAIAKNPNIDLALANRTLQKASKLADELQAKAVDNITACKSDWLFLGVKPYQAEELARQIKAEITDKTVIVSMMSSPSLAKVCDLFGVQKAIRIMPNTPVSVGSGITLYCATSAISQAELNEFLAFMAPTGHLISATEAEFDIMTPITGCGPAYAAMFMDAIGDAGVKMGLKKTDAVRLAAEMMIGTGQLLLAGEKSPSDLKDAVCSPKGTTIKGVLALEENQFRHAVIEAILAAGERK